MLVLASVQNVPDLPTSPPRLWHLPRTGRHAPSLTSRTLVGRQGIFTAARDLAGYELLFRAPGRLGLRVDLWNARQQDRATEHVIAAAFHRGPHITEGLPAFVNFTRSYLVERDHLHCDPNQVVIEVVESAYADDALRARLGELRAQGFRVAIDDFIGTRSQVALLDHADFVKIDYRDLTARGPQLVDLARQSRCTLIAERLETAAALAECQQLSFDLFQGHCFEPAITVDRGLVGSRDDGIDAEFALA
ncbi:MAG: diguanylate phosphodiesterase [Actinobacteria bacterium HGW-Actinobacteria-4]|nr:MAG: diguanylate phosphodiesterase [Actinobacteria bacterium HGW-Actinobacteria-4]